MTTPAKLNDGFKEHQERYVWMAAPSTRAMLHKLCLEGKIPATEDRYLNHLPLSFWDNLPLEVVDGTYEHLGQGTLSTANKVCILKAAAREILQSLETAV